MSRWTWYVMGTALAVPLLAWVDGHLLLGSQEHYWVFFMASYAEAFCLAIGYAIGRSVKQ